MTAIARQAPRHARAEPRRRRVVWVAWRQHRVAVAAAIVVLAGIGLLLLVTGLQMHSAWHALPRACRTPQELHGDSSDPNDPCGPRPTAFIAHYHTLRILMPHVLIFLPVLLGAFAGAPLVGRELESGTYKFAWTQGIDRVRWLLTKLLVVGVVLGTAAVGFSLLYTWWYAPLESSFGRIRALEAYEVEGIVFAARTLFAFALGVLLGAALRRSVPAMVATLVAGIGVILASVIWIRPVIQHAVVTPQGSTIANANQYTSWSLGGWIQDRAGRHISTAEFNAAFASLSPPKGSEFVPDPLQTHGWTNLTKFQPDNRFWHFQIVESVGYAVLAVALGAVALWWVRRRAT